ncbi:MAG: SocA family protein [Methanobrevibacter sp.]|jgi:uncharacterized protein YwgA|nr:SocA family protein [Methanobrevibacter sp.]
MPNEREKINKLKEVIHYITTKFSGLRRTQLIKLAYLIDRKFYKEKKIELTGIDYFMHFYGPYCNEFEDALIDLKLENSIHEESQGMGYKLYFNQSLDYDLNEDEIEIIDDVLQYADEKGLICTAKEIKSYVYELPEIKDVNLGDSIDFEKILSSEQS